MYNTGHRYSGADLSPPVISVSPVCDEDLGAERGQSMEVLRGRLIRSLQLILKQPHEIEMGLELRG